MTRLLYLSHFFWIMEGLDKEWLDCIFISSSWIMEGLDKEWLDCIFITSWIMEGLDKEWLDCIFITSWIMEGLDKEWLVLKKSKVTFLTDSTLTELWTLFTKFLSSEYLLFGWKKPSATFGSSWIHIYRSSLLITILKNWGWSFLFLVNNFTTEYDQVLIFLIIFTFL